MTFAKLPADGYLLFGTRVIRMFAYGFLSVVLVLYLAQLGLSEGLIGLLLSLTLIGDAAISLWMTTTADRIGRRRILIAGASLMLFAGVLFAVTDKLALLVIAAIIGVISPSGYEVGPFLPVEQAALSQIIPDTTRTQVFAWYNLVGSFATAAGALCGGVLTEVLQQVGVTSLNSYRAVLILYGVMGVILAAVFTQLSPRVEAVHADGPQTPTRFGLHRSCSIVLKLSTLFGLDAFAGGLVVQSLVAYWFHIRFGVEPAALGAIFLGANILAGGLGSGSDRPGEHHGVHSSPFECVAHARSTDAEPPVSDRGSIRTFQHLANGRAGAAILYHGCGRSRRTFSGCRHYGDCSIDRRRDFAGDRRCMLQQSFAAWSSIPFGRCFEDHIRRSALPRLQRSKNNSVGPVTRNQ